MAAYVELDGDWARRHPVLLDGVSMHMFLLRADKVALELLCDTMFAGPSGSDVEVTPILPAVLVVSADITRVRSDSLEDKPKGYLVERDIGVFVPVKVEKKNGGSWYGAVIPYLFVDHMAGVIGGREIYGFPKELAKIDIDKPNLKFKTTSDVFVTYGANNAATKEPVLSIEPVGPVLRTGLSNLPGQALADIADAVLTLAGVAASTLLGTPKVPSFTDAPLTFLKQFRDADNASLACHQSIVKASASVLSLKKANALVGVFQVTLPRYDFLRIADKLGLQNPLPGKDPKFAALGGFELEIDGKVGLGQTLWKAP